MSHQWGPEKSTGVGRKSRFCDRCQLEMILAHKGARNPGKYPLYRRDGNYFETVPACEPPTGKGNDGTRSER